MIDLVNWLYISLTFFLVYFMSKIVAKLHFFEYLSGRSCRLGAIDGLRGYLAVSVFICHFIVTWYWLETGQWLPSKELYFQNFGHVGVAIFFMITGFLFTSILQNNKEGISWLYIFKSRFFRIVPLYFAAVAIISFAVFYKTDFTVNVDSGVLIKQYFRWVIFHGSVINDYADTRRVIAGVDWTLKYEWLFYFSLPLLYILVNQSFWVKILAIVLVAYLFVFPVNFYSFSTKHLIFFAVGVCTCLISKEITHLDWVKNWYMSLISIVSVLVAIFYPYHLSALHVLFMAVFFIPVALGNDLFGLLSKPASILLGEISYSIYLLHGLVLFFTFSIFWGDWGGVVFQEYLWYMPLLALVVVLVSVFTFLYIENPMIKVGKNMK